jgi:hypothetical protein
LRSLVEDTLVHPEVRAAMKLLLSMESPEFEGDVLVDPGPDDAEYYCLLFANLAKQDSQIKAC